jgi:PAS domain S-box-containing protein
MQGYSKGTRTPPEARSDALPNLENASRAELQLTLEQLARANRRLALLNRLATRLMSAPQASYSDLFEEVAAEVGAPFYFYQRTDSHRPEVLLLAAASDQASEEDAARFSGILMAVSQLTAADQTLVLEALQIGREESLAPLREMGIQSFMRVPLLAQDRLLGVVSFGSTSRTLFQEADRELIRTFADQLAAALERQRLVLQLRESEQLYRGAVITGRLASWETNMVTRVRTWTKEGLEMFGLDLPNGRGVIGGDDDEFRRTLHPEDRHKVSEFHRTADEIDSYPAEYRIVRTDGRLMWMSGRGRVIERGPDGKARRVANIVVDVTERKKSEERTKLLIDELNHRVKNTLATVQAIVAQTLKNKNAARDTRETVEARLQSLARSHDLLTRENWEGAFLDEVVRQALHPFVPAGDDGQVRLEGRPLRLRPKVALSLGMTLHELATNASKYGALSVESGRVAICWSTASVDGKPSIEISWQESGGPPVRPRERKGFGSRLIEQGLAHELGGHAQLQFLPEGVHCIINFPVKSAEEYAQ